MELPCEEEDEEEVMTIPEPLKVGTSAFLHCKPNHDSKTDSHNPPSRTRTSSKVCPQKNEDAFPSSRGIGIRHSEFLEVAHVSSDVDDCEHNYGPRCRLVEGDAFVKWNELIQRGATKEGDEVATDG